MRIAAMTFIALTLGAGSALASPVATVTNDGGAAVLVDMGKGFAKIGASAVVPDGARVMVTPRAHATLAYADGCQLSLSPMSVTTVSSKVGCKKTTQVASADLTPEQYVAPAPVVATGGAPLNWALVGVGAGLAGGLIGYLIADGNTDTVYVPIPISN